MFTFLTTLFRQSDTRPSAFSMADPILGPFIHIFVDEKKNWEGDGYPARALRALELLLADGAPTVRIRKTFWRVNQVFFYKNSHTSGTKSPKIDIKMGNELSLWGLQAGFWPYQSFKKFWVFFLVQRIFGKKKHFLAKPKNGRFAIILARTRSVIILGHFLMAQTFPPSFVEKNTIGDGGSTAL